MNKPKWNLISDGLPPVGVPLIAAIQSHGWSGEKDNIRIASPVMYQKHFQQDRWCFWDCAQGHEIGPNNFTVIAWVEFPSTNELELVDFSENNSFDRGQK